MYVTGGAGFLGRHLLAAMPRGWDIIAPPSGSVDIRSAAAVVADIREWRPQAVVHLAYRRDDRAAIVVGSANVALAAAAVRARLVHLSTDVVFAGRRRPYVESDRTDAVIDYGRWKADAERQVADAHPTAVLVRTSLIYGTDTLARIQHDVAAAATGQNAMAFFTDELRCPVHAADLASAVARLAARPEVTGPLHVAGPDAIDRFSFATRMARWMGHEPAKLRSSTIAESGLSRPATVVLDTSLATELGYRCRSIDEALAANR